MNVRNKFLKLTEYTIPFGNESDLEYLLLPGWKKDSIGNYYYEIGQSKTLFTTHLDTHSEKKEKVNHVIKGNIIKTDGTTILGADNKAGCCVLLYMIDKMVPGTYYFFIGEEESVHKNYPYGSILALENNRDFFSKFERSISFDRKESGQLVTRQLGKQCCSDVFADALIKEFKKFGIDYKKDKTGYYTDSAFFYKIIPEIVNLSIGVWNEHLNSEYVDIKYVENIAKASCNINWELLPTKREINDNIDVDTRMDSEEIDLTSDQKIFQNIYNILDSLYYHCHEVRNYKSFIFHFKSGRRYHFTKWHEDEDLEIYVQEGKIYCNNEEFDNIESFKSWIGFEKMNIQDFYKLIMNEFKSGNGKISEARFNYLLTLKMINLKELLLLFKRKNKKIKNIGKGYQIVESNKYIKKLEYLDFSNTTTLTSISDLTNYYICDSCGQMFKSFNKIQKFCMYCKSNKIISVGVDTFYNTIIGYLDNIDDIYTAKRAQVEEKETLVDIVDIPDPRTYRN